MAIATQDEKPSYLAKPSFLVPCREEAAELLDEGVANLEELRASLNEIWKINRFFGRLESFTRFLPTDKNRTLRIADIGTGAGKLAVYLGEWARRNQIQLELFPIDFSQQVLSIAQENLNAAANVHLVQANGLKLPFAPNSIDYYLSSLVMHHFSPEALIELLGEAYERASKGIIMNDLVRGQLPVAAYHLIRPIFARQFYTWHDGLISIKRAYIPQELKAIADAAGIKSARIYQHFPWRMTLVATKQHG
jgi:hypothetical protein